jgi:hypothetical protein
MEIVAILRALSRHRILVAAGAVLAVVIGLRLAFDVALSPPALHSKRFVSGTATGRVLITARKEPTADLKLSDVSGTLGVRSILLADLLSTDATRAAIARGAHVAPDQLAVITPAMGPPPIDIPLAQRAGEAAATPGVPVSVVVAAPGDIPIITLTVGAPDTATAARVVDSATRALQGLIASKSRHGPALALLRLGPPFRKSIVTGSSPVAGAIAAVVLFLVWCAGIVLVAGVARRRREHRAAEALLGWSGAT